MYNNHPVSLGIALYFSSVTTTTYPPKSSVPLGSDVVLGWPKSQQFAKNVHVNMVMLYAYIYVQYIYARTTVFNLYYSYIS